jgi:transcriptional regulator with XRE-family HTH domain
MQALFVREESNLEVASYTDAMKSNRSALGERIARARVAVGLTQHQLSERLGVSQQMVGYLELRPVAVRPEMLAKISEVLGVSLDDLLGSSAPRKPSGPTGRVRQVFEEVSKLPRSRQQRIVGVVEDMLAAKRMPVNA